MTGRQITVTKLIAKQVSLAFNNSGMTKKLLCDRAGIYLPELNRVLLGGSNYEIKTLTKIVEALDIDFLLLK